MDFWISPWRKSFFKYALKQLDSYTSYTFPFGESKMH